MATYFYPDTAECQTAQGPYPDKAGTVLPPNAPYNTMGGYGGLLDINDYNGSGTKANIFITPAAAATAVGIQDLMPVFNSFPGNDWYLMRQVDFKDWAGIGGIFTQATDFIMEIDIYVALMAAFGGFRDEAPNLSLPSVAFQTGSGFSPYPVGNAQGCGISLKAIITDSVTHVEVVKDSHIFTGINGEDPTPSNTHTLTFPRQVIQLNLAAVKPEEIATLVLRVTTENYCFKNTAFPIDMDSTIYRAALTTGVDMKSSGKQSATMTSR